MPDAQGPLTENERALMSVVLIFGVLAWLGCIAGVIVIFTTSTVLPSGA